MKNLGKAHSEKLSINSVFLVRFEDSSESPQRTSLDRTSADPKKHWAFSHGPWARFVKGAGTVRKQYVGTKGIFRRQHFQLTRSSVFTDTQPCPDYLRRADGPA